MTYDEQETWAHVMYRMDNEGIEYCFKKFSSFEEVEDEKFHQIRQELINKIDEMRQYVQSKLDEDVDEDFE